MYALLTAGWWTPEITVLLDAGSAITRDQLVAFAQSLKATPIVTPIPPAPSVDLAADPLPAGWIALVTEDVPYAQRVTESVWVATVGGTDDSPNQLVVHTWTGVDQQGVYAKGAPIQAERITIRGRFHRELASGGRIRIRSIRHRPSQLLSPPIPVGIKIHWHAIDKGC